MVDFVSSRRTRVVTWAAPMSVVCLVFIFHGFPWTGLAWVSLVAFSAALWAGTGVTRSIGQVIDDIEAEPAPAIDPPVAVGQPALKAVL